MPHRRDHHLIDEQADHDRRRAEQNIVDEPHYRAEPLIAAIFGEIGAGQNPDRGADQHRQRRQDQAADDRVEQPAVRTGRRRHLGEDAQRQPGHALPDQDTQDQHEPTEPEQGGG